MQKEEFPTFLNEQPKVIFGRTGRELLVMVCGIVVSYSLWGDFNNLLPGPGWKVLWFVIVSIPALISAVVALVTIGNRPLEEWLFVWLFYVIIPKIYLYQPMDEDVEDMDKPGEAEERRRIQRDEAILDTLEED